MMMIINGSSNIDILLLKIVHVILILYDYDNN